MSRVLGASSSLAALLALALVDGCSGEQAAPTPPATAASTVAPPPALPAAPAAPASAAPAPTSAPVAPAPPVAAAPAAVAPAEPAPVVTITPLDRGACETVTTEGELDEHRSLYNVRLPQPATTSLASAIRAATRGADQPFDCAVRSGARGLVSITCAANGEVRVTTHGVAFVPDGEGYRPVALAEAARAGEDLTALARSRLEAEARARGEDESAARELVDYAFGAGSLVFARDGLLLFADGSEPSFVWPWADLLPHLAPDGPIARWGATCGAPREDD
jgi:type IV secretory pathway VirB10-like protein